ncbi:SDR family NAD(P)-dependent oxidoreductase [Halomonas sp. KM-1]|uniref:SDR family NAD(P)-dependent oxidoreductase n=1 Tax=Halomonas sp. KM-1 TaxID=590061 RepID=UPI0002880FF7|nr:glucose 1-dehydrogenase [Halomonas sp. KM-1]
MKLFDLTDRVAVVTGSNSGIGFGIALALAEAGATVIITGRCTNKNEEALAFFKKRGHRAMTVELDVACEKSCQNVIEATVRKFGSINILVNNAGINLRKKPEAYHFDEWRKIIDVNLSGAFSCCRAAYPYMTESGGGKIINIGSMLSIFGMPLSVPYAASKGGIVQMGRSLAAAWANNNIQVNTILPGWINTKMTIKTRDQIQGLHEKVLDRTPAGRWGETKDLAGASIFLASSASDFITGAVLPVDGGFSISG